MHPFKISPTFDLLANFFVINDTNSVNFKFMNKAGRKNEAVLDIFYDVDLVEIA